MFLRLEGLDDGLSKAVVVGGWIRKSYYKTTVGRDRRRKATALPALALREIDLTSIRELVVANRLLCARSTCKTTKPVIEWHDACGAVRIRISLSPPESLVQIRYILEGKVYEETSRISSVDV